MSLGFLTITSEGSATLRVPHEAPPFVLLPQLVRGVGSSAIHLDRGQPGSVRHVAWERAGAGLALVQRNTHYLDTVAGTRAAAESFARSVLFRTPFLDEGEDGVLIDVTGLAMLDLIGIRDRFALAGSQHASIDAERSWLLPDKSWQHESGLELSAELTVTGASGAALEQVAPDARSVTVTQRLTFLPLTAEPMPARRFIVDSGAYGKRFTDFGLPQDGVQETGWQPRFRLEQRADGGPGEVVRPIMFQVDPDIPEPWRSAVVEGAGWWAEGFERAGFCNAYRVVVRDCSVDPAAAGVNPVWWVHRSGRGWSMGAALTDPRSGEILKGNVRLGSQRIQQLTQLGEALLSPYGRSDEAERIAAVRDLVLGRIRQLAAHEVGHALGFMHNYASHIDERPSVMDYPHPVLRLDASGEVDLSGAYATGLGPWDTFAVRSTYEVFPGGEEDSGLAALREERLRSGHRYLTDDDGHGSSASAPGAVPWIFGTGAIEALDEVLSVREKALSDFSRGAVPHGAQTGELERRFVLIHLLHRYQVVAVARLIGGVDYMYGPASDPRTAPQPVPAGVQLRALDALCRLLSPSVVGVPEHVLEMLAPPSIRFARGGGDLIGKTGPVFDPLAAAAVAATVVAGQLFEPARLNRATVHSAVHGAPGPEAIVQAVFSAKAGGGRPSPDSAELDAAIAYTVTTELIRSAVEALRSGHLHPPTAAALRRGLTACRPEIAQEIAEELTELLADPVRAVPWPLPIMPDGVPI